MDQVGFDAPNWFAKITDGWKLTDKPGGGRFLDGTNWVNVAICTFDIVGIQSDGSLWVSEQPTTKMTRWERMQIFTSTPMERFGNDNDWKNVVGLSLSALLLKNDGTLWRLGTNNFKLEKEGWPGLRAFKPQRVGTDSDWAEAAASGYSFYLRKNDGRVWASRSGRVDEPDAIKIDEYIVASRTKYLDQHKWRGIARGSTRHNSDITVGVRDDGTFRMIGKANDRNDNVILEDVQLDPSTNWLAVVGNYEVVVALKTDGTLWKWNFSDDTGIKPNAASCVRLGTHSDWVAIDAAMGGIVSLATDGSLWFWQFEPQFIYRNYSSSSEFELRPLLGVSRKPQRIAGIFDKTN